MKTIVRKSLSLLLALTLCCSLPVSVLARSEAVPEPAAESTVKEIKIDFSGENVPSVDVTVKPGTSGTGSADASEVVDEAIEDELKDIREEMIEENGKARPVFDEKGNVIGFESTTVEFDEEGKRVTTIEQTTVNADTADRKVSASMSDVTNNGSGDPADWRMKSVQTTVRADVKKANDNTTLVNDKYVDEKNDLRWIAGYDYNGEWEDLDWENHAFAYIRPALGSQICIDLITESGSLPYEGPGIYELQNYKGDKFYAYCVDLYTSAEVGKSYDMINVEDAVYFSDDDAKHIRYIAENGYWGTEYEIGADGKVLTDADGKPIPMDGSLDAMKNMMSEAIDENGDPLFDADEIALLTPGVALCVTQAAIWYYGNSGKESCTINFDNIIGTGSVFTSSSYSSIQTTNKNDAIRDYEKAVTLDKGYDVIIGDANKESKVSDDTIALAQKLFEYMLLGESEATADTTAITANNAFTSTTITVNNQVSDDLSKLAEGGSKTYNVDVAFTLGVVPGDGDSLTVEVYQLDAEGNIVKNGNAYKVLDSVQVQAGVTDYTVNNLQLPNGSTITLNLSGINELDKGVYLYSAVTFDESQTMIGYAEGNQAVDLSVDLSFEVDDPVLRREKTVRTSVYVKPNIPQNDPPEVIPDEPTPLDPQPTPNDPVEILDEDVPMDDLVEIEEEEIPLAAVPQTGDNSAIFTVLSVLSGTGLAGLALTKKKNEK